MTSKEAMKRVRQFNQVGLCAEKFLLDIIEKDLEVLEIIRTHKLLNYVIKNKKCATMYHLTDEELNTLNESLKNEDTN